MRFLINAYELKKNCFVYRLLYERCTQIMSIHFELALSMQNNKCASLKTSNQMQSKSYMENTLALTCIIHYIDVGSQLRAGKVVAVLNWVIESRQQDEQDHCVDELWEK